jgi:hypothetical protein
LQKPSFLAKFEGFLNFARFLYSKGHTKIQGYENYPEHEIAPGARFDCSLRGNIISGQCTTRERIVPNIL